MTEHRHPDDLVSTIAPLGDDDGPAARRFCLAVIAEVFGYAYRADWHNDLDQLQGALSDYHPERKGCFLVARAEGRIVGCAGLRQLSTKPPLAERFVERYPDPSAIGSVWRVYVASDVRGGGLGRRLSRLLEDQAATLSYQQLYLHTTANNPRSVSFWQDQGYRSFCHDADSFDSTVHMDKFVTSPVSSRAQRSSGARSSTTTSARPLASS